MIREWHDWFRRQSRQRAFRFGMILMVVGFLGAVSIEARSSMGPWWYVATCGRDGDGHTVIAAPTNLYEECRNLAVVWPGLAREIAIFGALLVVMLLAVNRVWRSWACEKGPSVGALVVLAGLCLCAGASGLLICVRFVAIALP